MTSFGGQPASANHTDRASESSPRQARGRLPTNSRLPVAEPIPAPGALMQTNPLAPPETPSSAATDHLPPSRALPRAERIVPVSGGMSQVTTSVSLPLKANPDSASAPLLEPEILADDRHPHDDRYNGVVGSPPGARRLTPAATELRRAGATHPDGLGRIDAPSGRAGTFSRGRNVRDDQTLAAPGNPSLPLAEGTLTTIVEVPAAGSEFGGYSARANHHELAVDSAPPPAASGAVATVTMLPQVAGIEATAAELMALQKRVVFCTSQRVAATNSLSAFVRTQFLGFSTFHDEKARARACREAARLLKAVRAGQPTGLPADEALALTSIVEASDKGCNGFAGIEDANLARMERLAKILPGIAFVTATRGFGLRSFARIIGETGPLHFYANPAKVWKRLGLAVIAGERQRKHTNPELALVHGYNPRRRSVSWVAFESLLRAQGSGEDAGPYRQFYDHAKARYLAREWTKMHAHRAAARYAEKKLIRDLWRAWRQELGIGHLQRDDHHDGADPEQLRGPQMDDNSLPPASHSIPGAKGTLIATGSTPPDTIVPPEVAA